MQVRMPNGCSSQGGGRGAVLLALAGLVFTPAPAAQASAGQTPGAKTPGAETPAAKTLASRHRKLAVIHKNLNVLMALPSDREVQWAVVRLGCSGEAAVAGLSMLLDDPRLRVRTLVYRVLEEIGPPAKGSVLALVPKFVSKDPWERTRAAQLALTFDVSCEKAMHVLADTDNSEYRRRAACALGQASGARAVLTLTRLIDDKYARVRNPALRSLGQMGDSARPAIPMLIAALTDKRAKPIDVEDVPGALLSGGDRLAGADRALFELGPMTVKSLLKCHAKAGPELQFRVLNILGAMRDPDALRKAVRVSLRDEDAEVRRIAFACLMNLKPKEPTELAALLDASVRYQTAKSVDRIKRYIEGMADGPVAVLKTAFGKAGSEQRQVIVQVLGRLPASRNQAVRFQRTELLVSALRDQEPAVRRAAARSPALLGGSAKTLLPVLRTMYGARNVQDRRAARIGMVRLEPNLELSARLFADVLRIEDRDLAIEVLTNRHPIIPHLLQEDCDEATLLSVFPILEVLARRGLDLSWIRGRVVAVVENRPEKVRGAAASLLQALRKN